MNTIKVYEYNLSKKASHSSIKKGDHILQQPQQIQVKIC